MSDPLRQGGFMRTKSDCGSEQESDGNHRLEADATMDAIDGYLELGMQTEALEAVGQTLAQMALAWVLRDARMTSALIGASSVGQLEENIAALERLTFTDDELAEIDRYATDGKINIWSASSGA